MANSYRSQVAILALIGAWFAGQALGREASETAKEHLKILKEATSVTVTENVRDYRFKPRWAVVDDPKWIAELVSECEFDGEPYNDEPPAPLNVPVRVEVRPRPGAFYSFNFSADGVMAFHPARKSPRAKLTTLRAYERINKLLDEQPKERTVGFSLSTLKSYRGPRVPRGSIIDDFWVSRDADEFYFVSRESQDYFWCLPALPARLPGKVLRWDEVWWVRNEDSQLLGKDDLRTRFRAPKGIVVTPDEKWVILLHEGGLSTIDPSQPAEGRGAKRPTWLPALPHPDRRFHLNKAVFGKALYGIGDTFLATFSLDESTGELRLVQDEELHSPVAVSLAPDGRHLYVLGENSLSTFECLEGGRFKRLDQKEVESPKDVVVSPDGKNRYIAHPESIAVWKRDEKTGLATFEGTAGVRQPDMLQETDIVRVSPDGETLLAASTKTGTIVLFARDKHGNLKSQSLSAFPVEVKGDKKLVGVQYDASGKRVYAVRPSAASVPTGQMSVLEIR